MGREPVLEIQRLMAAVDGQRRTLGLSWNQVAWQSGIVPSTFTRMLQGGLPGLGTLCRLLGWLGETDLKPYLRTGEEASDA